MDVVVFDVDGVWLNNSHRLHFIQQRPKNWDAYLSEEEMGKDTAILGGIQLAHLLRLGGFPIVTVTGRPERRRQLTNDHLVKCGAVVAGEQLFMRSDGDFSFNHVFKVETARAHILPFATIVLWVDDNPNVAEYVAAELGVPVLLTAGVGQFVTEGV